MFLTSGVAGKRPENSAGGREAQSFDDPFAAENQEKPAVAADRQGAIVTRQSDLAPTI
jgi:hypothetical protein